jgi:hypothetical protein
MQIPNSEIQQVCYRSNLKLRGLAYLIEQLGSSDSPPENPNEVFYGISLVLEDLAQELKITSNKLEGTN